MTVEQIMRKRFLAFRETDRVGPVLDWMDQAQVVGGVVLNEKKQLVGLVYEKKLYQGLFQQEYDPLQVIENIMESKIITVDKNENWIKAAKKMRIYDLSILPIVENGHVLGILMLEDMLDQFLLHIESGN
ncbi:MAG: CBS domain-containing protein [Epulopiscium sp.]|nr:CBS domain-containing protein [Candidatus Epulonipiscium sp.]